MKKKTSTTKMYCDNCDGCGWYEGGKGFIQTTCEKCKGTGIVKIKKQ